MTAAALPLRKTDTLARSFTLMEEAGILTPTGLILDDPNLPVAKYERLGFALGRMHDASKWWIADWLVFGEATYGEKYAQAVEATGRSERTLMNYANIATKIPRGRRRPNLTFTHHAEVAALEPPDQERLLDWVEETDPPRCAADLRERVQDVRARQGQQSFNGADGGEGRSMVVEEVVRVAEQVYKAAQPDGAGSFTIEEPLIVRLGVVLGYAE